MNEAYSIRLTGYGAMRLAAFGAVAALAIGGLTAAYVPGTPLPAPNILVNPTAEIDQANEGSAVTSSAGVLQSYVVDGFGVHLNSTATTKAVVACQRATDAPAGYAYSLKCAVTTGASAVGSGDYLIVALPIEADNIQDALLGTANAQTLCRQWQVKSSVAGYTYGWAFQNFAQTRSLPNVETVSGANSWTPFKSCFSGDTGGSWVTSGSAGGAYLIVAIAAGATYQGSAGSWAGSNLYGTSALSNTILTTTGATFEITNAKLEISPVPTAFQRRPIEQELASARRYYQKTYDPGIGLGSATHNGMLGGPIIASGVSFGIGVSFKTSMRAAPTLTFWDGAGASGKASIYFSGAWSDGFTGVTAAQTSTNGMVWYQSTNNAVMEHFAADARLALP